MKKSDWRIYCNLGSNLTISKDLSCILNVDVAKIYVTCVDFLAAQLIRHALQLGNLFVPDMLCYATDYTRIVRRSRDAGLREVSLRVDCDNYISKCGKSSKLSSCLHATQTYQRTTGTQAKSSVRTDYGPHD